MTLWLSVIGIGEDGLSGLSNASCKLVETAEILIGGKRHLEMVQDFPGEKLTWRTPLSDTIADITSYRGKRVCILATGDPMWFGIGVTLGRNFSVDEMMIVPALSAFSMAAAQLGWSLDKTETITLHGRPLSNLARHLYPNANWMILSENGKTPAIVANWLCERGFGESEITVLEHLGGERQRIRTSVTANFALDDIADLNTIAVRCVAGENAIWQAQTPGLLDDEFVHDGQLTKREVRAATLAALNPYSGALLWDIGAGCGSVAIEWMRAAKGARAIAIESSDKRVTMIAQNAEKFGVSDIKIIHGLAPQNLPDGTPDAVFVGGGITNTALCDHAWKALRPGGRLVANVVTIEGEARLHDLQKTHGGELVRIAVSRLGPIGGLHAWKPLMQVTQWQVTKPYEAST
ncbi:MAG: cobalamin biosynthesis bifunctional protein CbiET [Hyphomicrobiales bacterium]|nr:MAG: cobalamin biosynthesis bifunctional protein CbiET [Hyphomicrobiales bacterium]